MRIIKITASFGKTVQIRQYEPVHFTASAEAELETGDMLEKCQVNLMKIVKASVDSQVEQVRGVKPTINPEPLATATVRREPYNG